MRFSRHAKLEHGLNQLDIAPLVNIVFLLLIFFILFSSFVFQSGIKVSLPRVITGDIAKGQTLVIIISGEKAISLNNKAVSNLNDLEKRLKTIAKKNSQLLIKADKRVSLGAISGVLDICRKSGVGNVNITTD